MRLVHRFDVGRVTQSPLGQLKRSSHALLSCIFHVTKKLGLVVDSSMEAEGIATSKIAEQISYVREILRAFGVPQEGPTFIGTDNTANQRVASGAAVPARSKHFLRRYHVLLERVRSREITIGHVPDRSMPADFLTKWIGASKLNVSVEHVTNRRHAPMQPEAI